MDQRSALEQTTADSDVPAALLELALGLADAVDMDTGNAALWREYRAAVNAVMEVVNGSHDDDVAEFRSAVSTPMRPALRDATNPQPTNSRSKHRSRS